MSDSVSVRPSRGSLAAHTPSSWPLRLSAPDSVSTWDFCPQHPVCFPRCETEPRCRKAGARCGLEGEAGTEREGFEGRGELRSSVKVPITPSKPRAPHLEGQGGQVTPEAEVTDSLGSYKCYTSQSPAHYFPLGLGLLPCLIS